MGQGDGSKVRCWRLFIFVTLFCGVMGGIITDGQNDGPLHRAKRYARIPLAYMNKVNPALFEDSNNNFMYNTNAKRWLVDRRSDPNAAPMSHFREFRLKEQNKNNRNRPEATSAVQNPLSGYPALPPRNTRLYQMTGAGSTSSSFSTGGGIRSGNNVIDLEDLPNQLSPLTDEELAKLLLLLDGFALSSKGGNPTLSNTNDNNNEPSAVIPEQYYNSNYLSPEDLRRVARMYTMGKRENEGRFLELEQPESLDNEGSNEGRLEFLTAKRSKRVGGPQNHKTLGKEANRMKKETDPKVIAQLQKVFENVEEPRALPASSSLALPGKSTTSNNNNEKSVTTDQSVSTTSTLHQPKNSGSEQVHMPSMGGAGNNKAKKAIDWSDYFGIDKKNGESHHHAHESSTATVSMTNPQKQQEESTGSTNSPLVKAKAIVANRITQPTKTMKETKEQKKLRVREENETENKSDRKWILNEFYKNMAMSTNIKRKRDASKDEADELADLQQKMAAAGDDIIWDALKYTGAHKDEPLSPIELAQVKKTIIERLATAYNLEKIREAIEEFREQLLGIKTNNV